MKNRWPRLQRALPVLRVQTVVSSAVELYSVLYDMHVQYRRLFNKVADGVFFLFSFSFFFSTGVFPRSHFAAFLRVDALVCGGSRGRARV